MIKHLITCISWICFALPSLCYAIDGDPILKELVDNSDNPKAQIDQYVNLTDISKYPEHSVIGLEEIKEITAYVEKHNYKKIEFFLNIAKLKLYRDDSISQTYYQKAAISSISSYKYNTLVESYLGLSSVNNIRDNYEKQYHFAQLAERISRQLNDSLLIAKSTYTMGSMLIYTRNSDSSSFHYLSESEKIASSKPNNKRYLKIALKSSLLKSYYFDHTERQKLNTQLAIYSSAQENKAYSVEIQALSNIAAGLSRMHKYDSSVMYYKKLSNHHHFISYRPNALIIPTAHILMVYIRTKNKMKADEWAAKLDKYEIPTENWMSYYKNNFLYHYNKSFNLDHKKAIAYYKKAQIVIKKSGINANKQNMVKARQEQALIAEQAQLAILEKEKSILRYEQQKAIFGIVGLSLIFLLGIPIAMFTQNKRKELQNIKEKALNQKLLRAQMNPHFISSNIAGIQGFLFNNDLNKALTYFNRFSKLMDLVINNAKSHLVSISTEIDTIQYYLDLQQLRLGDKFNFELIIDHDLRNSDYNLPPMLMHPFLESAIAHYEKYSNHSAHLCLEFKLENDEITMLLTNDCEDFAFSEKLNLSKRAKNYFSSQDLTKERLMLLNKSKNKKIKFMVNPMHKKAKINSTEILFKIPLQQAS